MVIYEPNKLEDTEYKIINIGMESVTQVFAKSYLVDDKEMLGYLFEGSGSWDVEDGYRFKKV